jgi:hypothetical protein
MWKIVSAYFIEHFGESKIAKVVDIPAFKIGYDPIELIHN